MRALLLSLMLLMLVLPHSALSEEQQEKEAWLIDPFWPEIDENNPPKCGGPEDYLYPYRDRNNLDFASRRKGFHQCAALFLKKLQAALREDDKKAIYKMLAKNCEWYSCRKGHKCRNSNSDVCIDGGDINSTNDSEDIIILKTEQYFIQNYHLIFHEKMKAAILQASVYNVKAVGSFSQPASEEPFIGLYMNLLWMNNDFSIAIINSIWSRDGCFVP